MLTPVYVMMKYFLKNIELIGDTITVTFCLGILVALASSHSKTGFIDYELIILILTGYFFGYL